MNLKNYNVDYKKLDFFKNVIDEKIKKAKDPKEIATLNDCNNIIYLIKCNGDLSSFKLKMTKHSGKLEHMRSFSSYQYFNNLCKQYQKNDKMICKNCYVKEFSILYNRLDPALIYNYLLLNYTIIDPSNYNELYNIHYFRFEAFGDIASELHFINYINIARFYKNTNFAIWSKNYKLILKVLKECKIPNNLNLIISSPLLNKEVSLIYINTLLNTKHVKRSNLKVFTVYEKDQIQDATGEECLKKCITCLKCYNNNKIEYIKEVKKNYK